MFGFDPDPEECACLNDLARSAGDLSTTYVPVALGPEDKTVGLYVTRQPACSSIYAPRQRLIADIPVLADIEVERQVDVRLRRLDEWCRTEGVEAIDVLKVDTQGSELGVLQGTGDLLGSCSLVECEVEFNPIYEGQPLFADVDAYLRSRGFVLWRLDNLMHYTDGAVLPRLDVALNINADARRVRARIGGGQLFWADGFWVRAGLLEGEDTHSAERAARLARAAGLPDLAARLWPPITDELIVEARRARRRRRERKAQRAARARAGEAAPGSVTSREGTASRLIRRITSRQT